MDCYILDKSFDMIGLVNGYESFIWNDNYNVVGDFELYTSVSTSFLTLVKPDYYLFNSESNKCMIIEDFQYTTDVENGNKVTITGRSLESILDRRIIRKRVVFADKDPIEIVLSILNTNIVNPSDAGRKIENFVIAPTPTNLPERTKVTVEYFGDSVLDAVSKLLQDCSIGFQITLTDDNKFLFEFYYGEDRSYNQDKNPYIEFSNTFNNIIDTDYKEEHSKYKNYMLIGGDQDSQTGVQYTAEHYSEEVSGLSLKEGFMSASSAQSSDDAGNKLPLATYLALLLDEAKQGLNDVAKIITFEGSVETHRPYVFRKDYFIGDLVQIVNPLGQGAVARIIGVIQSYSASGNDIVPNFEIINS